MGAWGQPKTLLAIVAGIVAALFALACYEIPIPGMPAEAAAPAKVVYNPPPSAGALAISVLAPPDRLVSGERVPLDILVANPSTHPVAVQLSWMANCFAISGSQPISIAVPALSSVLREIEVEPLCGSGYHPIALYFRPAGAGSPSESVASIAPIQLIASWKHIFFRFLFLFAALLSTLAIPAALACLAYFLQSKADQIRDDRAERDRVLQRAQEDRDQVFKQEREARDQRLKQEQDDRDRRESILRLRLRGYFAMVQKHYLPISRRMDSIESEAPDLLAAIAGPFTTEELKKRIEELTAAFDPRSVDAKSIGLREDIWKLLCAILLYRARLLSFLISTGGIYFRSNQAERLFTDLVNDFLEGLNAHLGKEEFRDAVDLLDPEDELFAAMRKCKSGEIAGGGSEDGIKRNKSLFAGLHDALKGWILASPVEFRAHTRLIQLASRILDFECDRPFYQTDPVDPRTLADHPSSGWYFDPPLLEFTQEMYDFPAALRDSLDAEIHFYIEHVPSECKLVTPPFPRPPAQPGP
jgi:hypothetical protein